MPFNTSHLGYDSSRGQNYHDGRTDAPSGRFSAVSAGGRHSCGLRADETVACWGSNEYGQSDAPAGLFSAVSAGYLHSCGLRADQTAECWGNNSLGESDAPMLRFLNDTDTSRAASVLIPRPAECHQQVASAGKPGPPTGVQIVRINLIGRGGSLLQPATVGWAGPCSGGSVDHYVVRWRRGYQDFSGESQRIVQSADTAEAYSFEIPDISVFAVRVTAVNSDGRSHSAEVMVPTPANGVRALLDEVVTTFEDRYPWLSEVGARMNRPDFDASDAYCGSGRSGCAQSDSIAIGHLRHHRVRDEQEARRQGWLLDLIPAGAVAVHEMAHVYHELTDLAVNPPAIAAGWVYLNDFLKDRNIVQTGDCITVELYADIPGILMNEDGLSVSSGAGYWQGCDREQGVGWLSQEGLDVMRSIYVDQEVPQWFYDTYQRADGRWDVEAIKETLGYYIDPDRSNSTYWQLRQLIPEL